MNTPRTTLPLMRERYLYYFEPSCPQRLLTMLCDLRKPGSSPEYKVALMAMRRLSAEAAAVLCTLAALSLLLLVRADPAMQERLYDIQWADPAKEPTPAKREAPVTPEKTAEASPGDAAALASADATSADAAIFAPYSPPVKTGAALTDPQMSPLPTLTGALPFAKTTGFFKPLIGGTRGDGKIRGELLIKGNGDPMTEDAVLRALRWLKKNQQADGSWKAQKIAMTGLAVLTFLAHGESPGHSPEFGETVQRALEFLLNSQQSDGRFTGADGNGYAHPIAAYALCEAYGMTLNPNVKSAAEKALAPLIAGQHPTGGWNYKMDPAADGPDGAYRDDTSYMGWCAQALKAAKLAHLQPEGLERALKLAAKGFLKNASPGGGFGYTAPGQGGLTSVGTLCLQLLGAADEAAVKKSLDLMDGWRPSFDAKHPIGTSLQYYFYYATQAKFHAGGPRWEAWNKAMKHTYVPAQQIEKGAIQDVEGKAVDIGWWTNGDAHTDRPVMDTCLAALQLMVYYRNLPTTRLAALEPSAPPVAAAAQKGDVPVHLSTNL